jgi:hypothetical protein
MRDAAISAPPIWFGRALSTTRRGTAKVVPNRGVKINHIFYWCEAFRRPDCHGKQVAFRFDPFDIGTAFAFLQKEWQTCYSEHYLTLRGHSERELMLATEELKRIHQDHSCEYAISGRRLADFLTSVEAEEVVLKQRLCDSERMAIRSASASTEPTTPADDPTRDHDAGEISSLEPQGAVEVYWEF